MATLRVADYTRSPGGRFVRDGRYSGEWFRETYLVPALEAALASGETLTVVLDGTVGYGSSFLEEAFGGLIRTGLFQAGQVKNWLKVSAGSPLFAPYAKLAMDYLGAASKRGVAA